MVNEQAQQVVVVADDPIEAGMLALDLVQAGLAAQAVRDGPAALEQVGKSRVAPPVLVVAYRDLEEISSLARRLAELGSRAGFVAVVLRSQRDAAEHLARDLGWSGVAVRPVNADELVALVLAAQVRHRPVCGAQVREGLLADTPLLELLAGVIDRIPTPGAGKDAEIILESMGRKASVAVVDGELVHAECDGETGRHALERVSCWRHGSWRLEPVLYGGAQTLTGSSLGLLAVAQEYARRVDEARQNLAYADCVCTVRWERVRPLPVVAEALFRRIAAGAVLADAMPGEGDDELEAYAALETRIKRGAVVPQIETAPPPAEGAGRTTDGIRAADGGRGTRQASGAESPRTTSMLQVSARNSSAAVSGSFRTGGFSAVPMTLVDAPQMPERRHSHPTTNLYRVGADGRPIETRDTIATQSAEPAGDLPPALPSRRGGSGIVSTGGGRSPSGIALTGGAPGPRKGMVTGWFGVGVGEGADAPGGEVSGDGGASNRARHQPTPIAPRSPVPLAPIQSRMAAPLRISDIDVRGDGGQRLAARPYAWAPAAPRAPDAPGEADPVPPPPKRRAWPWLLGAAASAAIVTVVLWPTPHQPAPHHDARSYQAAIELIDRGHDAEAMGLLGKLVQSGRAAPEALLHLAILEAEAGKYDAARAHLDAYLGNAGSRHVQRARRLYEHLFGHPNSAAGNVGRWILADVPSPAQQPTGRSGG